MEFKKYIPHLLVGTLAASCMFVWVLVLEPTADVPHIADAVKALNAAVASATVGQPSEHVRVAEILNARTGDTVAQFAAATKSSACTVDGPLPDHACSPGSVFADLATSTMCKSGYTAGVRNVSTKLKRHIYTEYGVAYPQPTGTYEVDHLVPLALGGDNSAPNLFPEAASPKPGFKEKDVVEIYLHDEVCAGRLPLAAAQEQIADDWTLVYKALDAATVSAIKQRYSNWSN